MNYPTALKLMQSRRSIRRFTQRELSRADIERLVDAARWAPSNHNRQGWKFIVFEDRAERAALAAKVELSLSARLRRVAAIPPSQAEAMIHHATLFAEASAVILVMHKRPVALARGVLAGTRNDVLISGEPLSAAMAVQNLLLAAHTLGLAACMLTAPLLAVDVWDALDDLPMGFEPTCLVAVGHPDEQPPPPRRKPVEQIVEYR